MKWPLRLLLALYSLILALFSLLSVLYIAGIRGPVTRAVDYLFHNANMNITTGLIAAGIFVLSLFTVVKSIKRDGETVAKESTASNIFVRESKLGQVSVSADALENVITKAARQVEGVREVSSEIKNTANGAAVYVKAFVVPTVNIPLISEEIQNTVKERMKEFAGIDAIEIRIFVENIVQEVRSGR